jgi:hypothetical protein
MSWLTEILGWDDAPDLLNPGRAGETTPEQMENIEAMMGRYGFTEDEREQVRAVYRAGGDQGIIWDAMDQVRRFKETTAASDRAQGVYDEGVETARRELGIGMSEIDARIGEVQTAEGVAGGRAADYRKMLEVPGMVRGSAEFGNTLAGAEQYINAVAENQRQTAGAQTAASGMRTSGGAADIARSAEQTAAGQKGKAFSEIMGQVGGKRDAFEKYKDELMQYRHGLGTQKEGIRRSLGDLAQGRFPAYMTTQGMRLGSMPTMNGQETLTGAQLSLDEYEAGGMWDILDRIGAGVDRNVDRTTNVGMGALQFVGGLGGG